MAQFKSEMTWLKGLYPEEFREQIIPNKILSSSCQQSPYKGDYIHHSLPGMRNEPLALTSINSVLIGFDNDLGQVDEADAFGEPLHNSAVSSCNHHVLTEDNLKLNNLTFRKTTTLIYEKNTWKFYFILNKV